MYAIQSPVMIFTRPIATVMPVDKFVNFIINLDLHHRTKVRVHSSVRAILIFEQLTVD